jgi:hypothetical protein
MYTVNPKFWLAMFLGVLVTTFGTLYWWETDRSFSSIMLWMNGWYFGGVTLVLRNTVFAEKD